MSQRKINQGLKELKVLKEEIMILITSLQRFEAVLRCS